MALSAPLAGFQAPGKLVSLEVANAATIYAGALLMFDTTGNTVGRVKPYDGTIGARLAGWATGAPQMQGTATTIVGNTSASPPPRAQVATGGDTVLKAIPVTGLTAVTTQGTPVYATADGTYTLTSPTTHMVLVLGQISQMTEQGEGTNHADGSIRAQLVEQTIQAPLCPQVSIPSESD